MKRLIRVGLFILGVHLPALVHAVGAPTSAIRNSVEIVQDILSDDSLDDKTQRHMVMELVNKQFDFPAMSRRILATHWKTAKNSQRDRFIALFSQILGNTYWHRIRDYQGEKLEYVGENFQNNTTARVHTVIITGTHNTLIDYSLHKVADEWRTYDVLIEGVSLVRNYRATYQQIIKLEGMDGLLEQMAQKLKNN